MEASRDEPFQLIPVKIIFDIQAESYSCSSGEFNLFQYFGVSVLMPFPHSLIWEMKLDTAKIDHCNLSLWNFFEDFWMTNSHVFRGN